MNIEFTDNPTRLVTGINDLEPGDVFLWAGIVFIVTVEGAVSLRNGHLNTQMFFADEQVEVLRDEDVMVVIRR